MPNSIACSPVAAELRLRCRTVALWLGPTASGKSDAALALAERMGAEIISLDSAQVYRGLDIGTAKPDLATRARIPHHLIDLIEPTERYSVARFARDLQQALAAVEARGGWPLVVGGTMMYANLLLQGMSAVPPTDPAVREELAAQAERNGLPALYAQLAAVDPALAARLSPGDRQRILRGLEVYRVTGRPLSAWQGERQPLVPGYGFAPMLWLPSDRAWLHARCAARLQAMWRAGFVSEVIALRERYALTLAHPSMRTVGYRQIFAGLDAGASETRMQEQALFATRQLAKRQITWLRSFARSAVAVSIVHCDEPGAERKAAAWFERCLARSHLDEPEPERSP
ncbi:MAG: tRNA (adenosine(37)-N6)-dimethylallyltransferase MiaA [Burkholderiales bacterium]|nr:tRNA (adenosine(37)-N6)-dimethylallyltransferase MiaA [Burkholderiales bacterium]